MTTFLHTADWQIGKPFQSISDNAKREALRAQRLETIRGLKSVIDSHGAQFVVVAGDLFDSFTPDKSTVAALCSAVGELTVPVYAIPGNHDHGGPGCIWRQPFFLSEQAKLAPNLQVLLDNKPLVTDNAVLFPCPLLRRQQNTDPTAWLRDSENFSNIPSDRPHFVIAHGSTQGFSSSSEEDSASAVNNIDLDAFAGNGFDYVALGDWHGMKQITPNAWYPGTPEQDRYAKGSDNIPGHTLVVQVSARGATPMVESISTGQYGWHDIHHNLSDDAGLGDLRHQLDAILESRTNRDLLKLNLNGTLSLAGANALDQLIESLQARLLDLRLQQNIDIEPSPEELASLTEREDPLISQVARQLVEESHSTTIPESAELAKTALRELHLQLQRVS